MLKCSANTGERMAYSPLPDSDVLLIIDMCDEGIEKCDLRAADIANHQAASWNAQVRERYVRLRADLLVELVRRREATFPQSPVAQQPHIHSQSDTDT